MTNHTSAGSTNKSKIVTFKKLLYLEKTNACTYHSEESEVSYAIIVTFVPTNVHIRPKSNL